MLFANPAVDVVLIGTGVAPLVAAVRLLAEHRSVMILNPEWDFFSENSEFSFDPLFPIDKRVLTPERLKRSTVQKMSEILCPDFPGPIEFWSNKKTGTPVDATNPYIRERERVWIDPPAQARSLSEDLRDTLETMYLEASDAGLNPQYGGALSLMKLPGVSTKNNFDEHWRSISLPRLGDVDVLRYRIGLLEYLRERLGPSALLSNVSQIDLSAQGVRFYGNGQYHQLQVNEGVLIFLTPKVISWAAAQAKQLSAHWVAPDGLRCWENWSLVSRESLNPNYIGMYRDLLFWAEIEGSPLFESLKSLSVLRAGPLVPLREWSEFQKKHFVGSRESFDAISDLCTGFLKWDKFSIRDLKPRLTLEFKQAPAWWQLYRGSYDARVVCGADGALCEVVRNAKLACEGLGA